MKGFRQIYAARRWRGPSRAPRLLESRDASLEANVNESAVGRKRGKQEEESRRSEQRTEPTERERERERETDRVKTQEAELRRTKSEGRKEQGRVDGWRRTNGAWPPSIIGTGGVEWESGAIWSSCYLSIWDWLLAAQVVTHFKVRRSESVLCI